MALEDYWFEITFYAIILLIVFLNRKKFDIQGKIIALYRTRFGLRLMDRMAEKYRELVRIYGLTGIGFCVVGIPIAAYMFILTIFKMIEMQMPYDGSPVVIPGVPLAGLGIKFPLIIGWISLFIIMIVHEFSHGVVARANKIKVKSSGLAFFGPILGAFVEPDEKQLEKADDVAQYSVFSAGPFSNIVLFVLIVLISSLITTPLLIYASEPAGIEAVTQPDSPIEQAGLDGEVIITGVNGTAVEEYADFRAAIQELRPNQTLILTSKQGEYNVTLGQNPANSSIGYIGLNQIKDKREPKMDNSFGRGLFIFQLWLEELLYWTGLISFAVALFNVYPIFITDGARLLRTAFLRIYKDEKTAIRRWILVNQIGIAILFAILLIPAYFSLSGLLG
jgi:membrane-associated protease RseP (regulator of RpoE activity)